MYYMIINCLVNYNKYIIIQFLEVLQGNKSLLNYKQETHI